MNNIDLQNVDFTLNSVSLGKKQFIPGKYQQRVVHHPIPLTLVHETQGLGMAWTNLGKIGFPD